MIYNDIYEIGISFYGKDIDLTPVNYSFMISDSIYSIFPKAKLSINDNEGLLQQYLISVEGTDIELSFGYKNNFIKNKYIVNTDSIIDSYAGKMGGYLNIELDHYLKTHQRKEMKVYKDTISRIIKKILDKYEFSKININDSGASDYYYQPFINDFDFIENFLLPFSFSNNSKSSPFYCFINNNNEFNYRNYMSMMNGKPLLELKQGTNDLSSISPTNFSKITRFRTDTKFTYEKRHRKITKLLENGVLEIKEDFINDYPDIPFGDLPLILPDRENFTGSLQLFDDESTLGKKEINMGMKIQSMRSAFALERLLLVLPLNVELLAGKNVNIIINASNSDKSSDSYSGEYLIERSFHKWEGQSNLAETTIIVSRKSMQKLDTNIYPVKTRLVKS